MAISDLCVPRFGGSLPSQCSCTGHCFPVLLSPWAETVWPLGHGVISRLCRTWPGTGLHSSILGTAESGCCPQTWGWRGSEVQPAWETQERGPISPFSPSIPQPQASSGDRGPWTAPARPLPPSPSLPARPRQGLHCPSPPPPSFLFPALLDPSPPLPHSSCAFFLVFFPSTSSSAPFQLPFQHRPAWVPLNSFRPLFYLLPSDPVLSPQMGSSPPGCPMATLCIFHFRARLHTAHQPEAGGGDVGSSPAWARSCFPCPHPQAQLPSLHGVSLPPPSWGGACPVCPHS